MTAMEIALVVLYFIIFFVVIRFTVRYINRNNRNPLDRENNMAKMPTKAQKRSQRPGAHQNLRKMKR